MPTSTKKLPGVGSYYFHYLSSKKAHHSTHTSFFGCACGIISFVNENENNKKTVRVFSSHEAAEKADLEYWLALTPQERLDAVGDCVREYLALKNESEQRFRRIYRVLDLKAG